MATARETRSISALWYAWGQIDAGAGAGKLTLDDGFAFQREAEQQSVDFEAGKIGILPSLLTQWETYCKRVLDERS